MQLQANISTDTGETPFKTGAVWAVSNCFSSPFYSLTRYATEADAWANAVGDMWIFATEQQARAFIDAQRGNTVLQTLQQIARATEVTPC